MRHDGGLPMRRDTVFRMASTTKPVAVAAAMVLLDECRLRLDDPTDRWLSGGLRPGVAVAGTGGSPASRSRRSRANASLIRWA
ncbi:serine hydrolase domain-containing protein [Streptomyces alanosinicus]|uniref:serine hydrolase domain-containing protein n=1 Tax=Streptomyces alanosinicus TaxID=68171 RepID=UPI001E489FE4|nr:serine hydrolase domain-containing protein [Streptomyces alanosinicus]